MNQFKLIKTMLVVQSCSFIFKKRSVKLVVLWHAHMFLFFKSQLYVGYTELTYGKGHLRPLQ